MKFETLDIILLLSGLSGLVAIITGWRTYHLLWFYAILSFLSDANGIIFLHEYFGAREENKLWYGNIYFLGEFLFFASYFLQEILPVKKLRYGYIVSFVIALSFILHSIKTGTWWDANFRGGAVLYALLIPVCFASFYHLLHSEQPVRIESSPLFISSTAILLFTAGSFLLLLFEGRIIEENKPLFRQLWSIHNVLNILKNLAIAYSLHLYRISPKSEPSS